MSPSDLARLTPDNRRLLELREEFLDQHRIEPARFWPFLAPCEVKLLLVVDGLDFSDDRHGLSTFVRSLLEMPGVHVRFRITLAHIGAASATQMLDGEPRVVRRITSFRFDDKDHFTREMYDEVMLFGFAETFAGRGTASDRQPYPPDRLAEPELRALTEFMNAEGGLFATGDHGQLGRFLCHAVPRARNMRLWQSTSAQNALDQVSMGGERRNDTNRVGGSAGSQFDDQSDDVPQPVQPKLYRRRTGFFRFTFPHPLLCGPDDMIRIMPDHPHEGECVEPEDPDQQLAFGAGPEYPPATDGGSRPLPEIISTSTVLSGTRSGDKDPTVAQSFGGICAYDGHRAGIGRVVTDATWHHFVNVNLVGEPNAPPGDPKQLGFLASTHGQAHFEAIKAYYRNLAVWLAPSARIRCMNARLSWQLVWSHRVMEAVLSTTAIGLADVPPHTLKLIGQHARDVLGRLVGQCQSVGLVLDLVWQRAMPELIPDFDPWRPDPPGSREQDDRIDWFDGSHLLDISFGAALVALRNAVPQPDERKVAGLDTDKLAEIIAEGGRIGVELAFGSAAAAVDAAGARFKR